MPHRPGLIRRLFGFLWRLLDFSRRLVLNLAFLALAIFLVGAWFYESKPTLEDTTTLVLDLKGPIVEQSSSLVDESTVTQLLMERPRETRLRDVLTALDDAAKEARITRVLLLLDDFEGAGQPTLHEIAGALERVKAAGKPVVAWATSYDQRQYYLAAHANEVYVHPQGRVLLRGFGGLRNYYRDALDRIGVTVNVFRVGKFKSYGEPYVQNEPSPAAREADQALVDDLWLQYTQTVETARKLPDGSIARMIAELPQRFAAAQGDAAQLALTEKLVDGIKTRDELRALMIERGVADKEHKTFRQINFPAFLARHSEASDGDAVGIIVASGSIVDGSGPPGSVGGRTTGDLIRRARDNDHIKALVLRVNSPGGGVLGSELIRRELELTRKAGKPVVVSFGDVAASGGYWISLAADEVIAEPATITGSIGVFALLPNFEQTMQKLSLHASGVSTTWLATAADPRRALDPRMGELIQASISHSYDQFIGLTAAAHKLSPERVNEVAQGRVLTGRQAKERELVDRLGSFTDALQSAAARAKLPKDARIVYLEREPRSVDRALSLLLGQVAQTLQASVGWDLSGLLGPAASAQVRRDLEWLRQSSADPFAAVAHCLCEPL